MTPKRNNICHRISEARLTISSLRPRKRVRDEDGSSEGSYVRTWIRSLVSIQGPGKYYAEYTTKYARFRLNATCKVLGYHWDCQHLRRSSRNSFGSIVCSLHGGTATVRVLRTRKPVIIRINSQFAFQVSLLFCDNHDGLQ